MTKLFFAVLKRVVQTERPTTLTVAKLRNEEYALQDETEFFLGVLVRMRTYLTEKSTPWYSSVFQPQKYTLEEVDKAVRRAIDEQVQKVKNLSIEVI